jgi:hypothetical protein
LFLFSNYNKSQTLKQCFNLLNSKNKNKLGLKKHRTQRRTAFAVQAFAVLAFTWTGGWKLGRLEHRSPELASPPLVPHATVVQTKETKEEMRGKKKEK